jgi:hypothetical protein
LNLEKEGLYHFAIWHTNKSADWKDLKEKDKCSLCETGIMIGDKFTELEITEEVQNGKTVETSEAYCIAILCENCAQKYAVWL